MELTTLVVLLGASPGLARLVVGLILFLTPRASGVTKVIRRCLLFPLPRGLVCQAPLRLDAGGIIAKSRAAKVLAKGTLPLLLPMMLLVMVAPPHADSFSLDEAKAIVALGILAGLPISVLQKATSIVKSSEEAAPKPPSTVSLLNAESKLRQAEAKVVSATLLVSEAKASLEAAERELVERQAKVEELSAKVAGIRKALLGPSVESDDSVLSSVAFKAVGSAVEASVVDGKVDVEKLKSEMVAILNKESVSSGALSSKPNVSAPLVSPIDSLEQDNPAGKAASRGDARPAPYAKPPSEVSKQG